MTDNHGFAFTVENNALRPLRQNYISTTYNPDMNGVYGHSHYHFKFVLDGKGLVEKYGGFDYDHHTRMGDEMISLNEKEIGINTNSIEPIRHFLKGTVLLFPMFSQTAIQWLLYDNDTRGSFMDASKAAAPRAIEALYKHIVEWRKPLWIGEEMRKPTSQEWTFLKDCFAIHEAGGDFNEGMLQLADKYPIIDHARRVLDRRTVERKHKTATMVKMLNAYYQKRKIQDTNPAEVRKIITTCIGLLQLGDNVNKTVIVAIEQAGLFHPLVAPVDWGIIIKPLVYGDVDECLEAIDFVKGRYERLMQLDKEDPDFSRYGQHAGTDF
jgi:hypothetical protein